MKLRLKTSLLLSSVLCSALAMAQSSPHSATLYENVRVFNGTSDKLSAPTNVLVVGNTIKTISNKPVDVPEGVTVTRITGDGRTLMPGLIDMHTHIYLTAPMVDYVQPNPPIEKLDALAASTAKDMLMNGFTTIRDMAGPMFDLKASIDQGKLVGPRIYPSGTMISQTSGHCDYDAPKVIPRSLGGPRSTGEILGICTVADGRDQVLAAVRYNLRQGASQIKIAVSGGVDSPSDPVTTQEYTADEIRAAVEAANDFGAYVASHGYNVKAVRRALDAGVKSIEHGQLLDEATVKYIKSKDAWLSTQNLPQMGDSYSPLQREKDHEVIQGQSDVFKWALKYNVKMAWGTDFTLIPEGQLQNIQLAKLTEWMTPARALKLVTRDNAQLLAMSGIRNPYPGKLGVVEQGAYADLLLVDGDPTKDLKIMADPSKNFRVIMKDGKIYKNTI